MVASRPAEGAEVGQLRREVVQFARANGASEETAEAVRLAVSEALSNVVMHAYPAKKRGAIDVEAWAQDGHLTVRVCDQGTGLVPRMDRPGVGLGLGVIAQLSDAFTIGKRENIPGTVVELCFRLDRERSGHSSDRELAV